MSTKEIARLVGHASRKIIYVTPGRPCHSSQFVAESDTLHHRQCGRAVRPTAPGDPSIALLADAFGQVVCHER